MPKMPMPHRNSSTDSDSIRKRVGKACDRCRLKKSKCDGSSPCSRCKADNAICVFGERKKSHDKVYPKGYVEMLEQQQSQLVAGLQETYRRLVVAQAWPGLPLAEHNGNPLTHDILARLDLLEFKEDGSSEMEFFEEDCHKLQERLVSDGAPFVGRRGSFSSESDHGDHEHSRPQQPTRNDSLRSSLHDSPALSHSQHEQPVFSESWNFQASPSPLKLTPPPKMKQAAQRASTRPSPLSHVPLNTDCIAPWHEPGPTTLSADFMRLPFDHQTLQAQEDLAAMMNEYAQSMDDAETGTMAFNPQFASHVPGLSMYNPQDWMNEPMDVDFSKFVQVSAT